MLRALRLPCRLPEPTSSMSLPQRWPLSPMDASRCHVLHGSSFLRALQGVNWSTLIHGAPGCCLRELALRL